MMADMQPEFTRTLEELEAQVKCAQCLKSFSEPKLLSCFHIFCNKCLLKLVVQDQQGQLSVRCPTCRRSTILPATSVSGLQPAFHIHHLLEMQQLLIRFDDSDTSVCEKCKQHNQSTHFCQTCNQLICKKCYSVHELWEELSDHQIASLHDIHEDISCLVPHKQVVTCCLHHPSMAHTLHCETCMELICNKCTLLKHKSHSYKMVNKVIEKCKKDIAQSQKSLKKKVKHVGLVSNQLATQSLDISSKREALEESVQQKFSELHRAIDKKKEETLNEIKRITQGRLEAIELQKIELQSFKSHIGCCLEFAEKSFKFNTELELMSTTGHVVGETNRIMQHKMGSIERIHIEFNMPSIPDLISQIGELQTTVETQEELPPLMDDSDSEEEESDSYVNTACLNGHLQRITNGDGTLQEFPVEEYREDNEEEEDYQQLEPLSSSSFKKFSFHVKQPRGITLNSDGELIVTSEGENCVKVFNQRGEPLKTITVDDYQLFNTPSGIVTDKDGNILVVDTCNHQIQCFTSQWSQSRIIGEAGSDNPLEFSNPYGIGINPINGKIYICDNCNHRIQVLHSDLSFHCSFGSKGNKPSQFNHPWGVGFDSKANVYVADSNNHRIQVFSAEGKFIREFGSEGKEKGKLKLPHGVAVDSEGMIYVSELANNRVSVFTDKGVFQRVIGYKGSGPNQLRKPRELVLDSEGVLYICDYGNNRIQVFNTC